MPVELAVVFFLLPLFCAVFYLYFEAKRLMQRRMELVLKCTGTFLNVLSCGLGLAMSGAFPLSRPLFWFFLLCTVADLLLELHFVTGMLVFAAAHVGVLWTLGAAGLVDWPWTLAVWLALMVLGCVLFRRELVEMKGKGLPFLFYFGVLASAAAFALPSVFIGGAPCLLWTIGMGCFFVSDLMVGKSALSHLDPKWEKPVMALYWGAQLLISLWVW